MSARLEIRLDDLSGEPTRSLLAFHLREMHANSPSESVFALDLSALQSPEITVLSAWWREHLAGVGALKVLPDGNGELKSMRTHPDFLRQGVASALLEALIDLARARGVQRVSLETGSGSSFEPALALYRQRGFLPGEAFGDYQPSAFNLFFHLEL